MNRESVYAIAQRWIAAAILVVVPVASSAGQQAPGASPSLPAYRPPALALVQPAAGGSLPEDKPVIVFRFAPGEPNDPIDARSFGVSVNGVDRTELFQVSAAEAWGALGDPEESGVNAGPHHVAARICSARGACAEISATVSVVEASATSRASSEPSPHVTRRKVVDAVVSILRKLLEP